MTPTDWKLTYDGETISLNPSVGNWNLACRSHYVIKKGRVIEAGPWSDDQVAAERKRDRNAKARHYGTASVSLFDEATEPFNATTGDGAAKPSRWERVRRFFAGHR